uniref:Uncharacterized protein n=1 Tax=Rhizophora mucronata TaxID=61149 RepID=A0A2P2NVL2_RHIMU
MFCISSTLLFLLVFFIPPLSIPSHFSLSISSKGFLSFDLTFNSLKIF